MIKAATRRTQGFSETSDANGKLGETRNANGKKNGQTSDSNGKSNGDNCQAVVSHIQNCIYQILSSPSENYSTCYCENDK